MVNKIFSFMVLIGVVLASLTGSVLGNLLLVAGLSFFVGGLKFKRQKFSIHNASHNSGLLMFAVIVAFVIPEVFSMTMNESKTLTLSVGISIILILLFNKLAEKAQAISILKRVPELILVNFSPSACS